MHRAGRIGRCNATLIAFGKDVPKDTDSIDLRTRTDHIKKRGRQAGDRVVVSIKDTVKIDQRRPAVGAV